MGESNKNLQVPYFLMALHVNRFSPFICNLGSLENTDMMYYETIRKRQIIAPFDFRYYYSKLIQWKPSYPEKLLNYEKSELSIKRLMTKVSYNDVLLFISIFE